MINYFEFYELPVKFNLDEQALKARYFDLLKRHHPDFFVNNPEKYKEALLHSSLNNEAYKCLSDFHRRASYIIQLSNVTFEEKLPSSFLMEMMDINEALSELQFEPNPSETKKASDDIQKIEDSINTKLQTISLKSDVLDLHDESLLRELNENLLKHKYLLRLKETLANIATPN